MYFLTNINQSFQVATKEAIALAYTALDVTCVYVVNSGHVSADIGPVCKTGYLDNTFREILPAPHFDATQHSIKSINIVNTDSIAHILTFRIVDLGNARNIYKATLEVGYSLEYNEKGFTIYNEKGIKINKAI